MRLLIVLLFCIFSTSVNCQISEVTYDIETNDTLSVKNYSTDKAEWVVEDSSITWFWYDKDSNILANEEYTIVSTKSTETGFIWSYTVSSQDGGMFIIEFWILMDGSKAVSYRYADGVVHYSGNVFF